MSLRIKLPALKPLPPPSPTPAVMEDFQWDEQPKRKRKRSKRYVGSDGDDSLVADADLAAETSVVANPRRRDPFTTNSDIDVVGEEEHEHDSHRSEPSNHAITHLKLTKTKSKPKVTGDGPSVRKKTRRIVASDPETGDEYLDVVADTVDSGHEFEDDNENDFLSDPKPTTKSQNGKGKAAAITSTKGGTKRRLKADNTSEVSTISKKRPNPTLKSDEVLIDAVGDGSPTPNVSIAGDRSISKHDSLLPSVPPQQLPPKKQKLPTIKKVKLPHLNAPTVVKDSVVLSAGSKPVQDGVRKTLTGTTDIDLSNKSIYEEIFSKTGQGDGGAPRAGGNRRTKEEERRKELSRQRDEAKAKWALEARPTFDLQAQFDKISRFEEKLKAEHSSALYPNFLAGKWREEWEKEKRRQKGKDWHDSRYPHESTTREEGEVR